MEGAEQTRRSDGPITFLAYAGVAIGSALIFFAGYGFAVSHGGSAAEPVASVPGAGASSALGAASSADLLGGVRGSAEDAVADAWMQRVALGPGDGSTVPLITVRAGVATRVVILSPMHGMPGWVGLAPHSVTHPIADGTVNLPPLDPGTYTLFGDGSVPLAHVVAR